MTMETKRTMPKTYHYVCIRDGVLYRNGVARCVHFTDGDEGIDVGNSTIIETAAPVPREWVEGKLKRGGVRGLPKWRELTKAEVKAFGDRAVKG